MTEMSLALTVCFIEYVSLPLKTHAQLLLYYESAHSDSSQKIIFLLRSSCVRIYSLSSKWLPRVLSKKVFISLISFVFCIYFRFKRPWQATKYRYLSRLTASSIIQLHEQAKWILYIKTRLFFISELPLRMLFIINKDFCRFHLESLIHGTTHLVFKRSLRTNLGLVASSL
jgi:hypothetical protein